jgi:capsule biosynthesis phosphatase
MNIIIPIGGTGERFKKAGYSCPKPLIKALGESIINLLLKKLNLSKEDKIFIFYNSELDEFNFKDVVIFKNKNLNIYFIKIDFQTRGAAETILSGINKIPKNILNDDLTLCLDCDTLYEDDIISKCKKINNNLIFFFKDLKDKPIYSYIKIKNNKVLEIKEKIKISDNANVGAYCFKKLSVLKKFAESLVNEPLDDQIKEYYISSIYNLMLKDNIKIYAKEIEKFNCLGTPEQLEIYCLKNKHGLTKKRICFDLDNTLVTFPKIPGDYTSVEPIKKNIEYLKFIKSLGHTIIIYTARRMRTHSGNISAVIQDIGQITFDTLKKFDIPYDEIYFGKPYADFYVDDIGFNVYENLDKNLGFYQENLKSRSFNYLEDTGSTIIKKSEDFKLQGEIYWYKFLKTNKTKINKYFPKLINYGSNFIEIEKIQGITAAQLFVNLSLTKSNLLHILNSLEDIHKYKNKKIKKYNIYQNYASKIEKRYKEYDYSYLDNHFQIYKKLIDFCMDYENKNFGKIGAIHGDPVFSNIIIDKENKINFIDMRGVLGKDLCIFGDIFYDYAKVFQSIIGYDFIFLDKNLNLEYQKECINIFDNFILNKYDNIILHNIKMITNTLLFTLIPLHDNPKNINYFKLINLNI